jgi:hypothetical protein
VEDMCYMMRRTCQSRGLCRLVCPSRTSERGGKGDCVKEGGGLGEEGESEREPERRGARAALSFMVTFSSLTPTPA